MVTDITAYHVDITDDPALYHLDAAGNGPAKTWGRMGRSIRLTHTCIRNFIFKLCKGVSHVPFSVQPRGTDSYTLTTLLPA